jgi:N-acetylneuraminic acid mutarotase
LGCADDTTTHLLWPAARNGHAATFNDLQKSMLIFGGTLTDGEDNTLWSYRNGDWTLLSNSGPEKREDALLVHHSANQKTYLIGGRSFSSGQNFSDFWGWDGLTWSKLSDTPFGSLTHAAATYDTKHDRILVFGGSSGNTLRSDLWIWDGSTWEKSSATGPSARLAASLHYSAAHEKVYLFGGSISNGSIIKEVWELDNETWTKLSDEHPAILTNAYGVAPYGNNFILFGGFKENRQQGSETWIYNVTENAWTSTVLTPPTPRALHSMVYDVMNQRVLMFGGSSAGTLLNELWIYNNDAWGLVES